MTKYESEICIQPEQMAAFAREVAEKAHKNQVDKSGKAYINHPQAVADQLDTHDEKTVAFLHDVCEDSDTTPDDLHKLGFPPRIVTAVEAITKREEENYSEYLARVKMNQLARKVKRADLLHNMDVSRIENPTKRDIDRCKKYIKAFEALKG